MHKMRTLGLAVLLAGTFSAAGCDDDDSETGDETMTTVAATDDPTMATETATDAETTDSEGDSSSGGGIDCSSPPSHDAVIQPIWDANCVTACHEPGGSWPTMDLTAGMAYDFLVDFDGVQTQALSDVQIVIASDTENSYLLNKLDGTQEAVAGGAAGTQMPQGADPLSDDDIALVEQWIACGAEP